MCEQNRTAFNGSAGEHHGAINRAVHWGDLLCFLLASCFAALPVGVLLSVRYRVKQCYARRLTRHPAGFIERFGFGGH